MVLVVVVGIRTLLITCSVTVKFSSSISVSGSIEVPGSLVFLISVYGILNTSDN